MYMYAVGKMKVASDTELEVGLYEDEVHCS